MSCSLPILVSKMPIIHFYLLTIVSVLQLLCSCSLSQYDSLQQYTIQDRVANAILKVRAELIKAEIIPTVINDFTPSLILNVTWPSNATADLGNTIKIDDVQKTPSVMLHEGPTSSTSHLDRTNMTYTIALTDPDAPSRDNPKWSEMCHWIATNVQLSSDSIAMVTDHRPEAIRTLTETSLNEIVNYKPPGPPPKTGKHRYVFLIFAPANSTSQPITPSKPDDRKHWGTGKERHGVRDWAEENGLVPVAANFIYAQDEKQ